MKEKPDNNKSAQNTSCIQKIKEYIKKDISKIFILLLTILLTLAYFDFFMDWYDDNVIPMLALFKSSIWVSLVTGFIILLFVIQIRINYKLRYKYDIALSFVLLTISLILFLFRVFSNYNYEIVVWGISYVDVISVLLLSYFIAAIINFFSKPKKEENSGQPQSSNSDNANSKSDLEENNSEKESSSYEVLFYDGPIENIKDDIFDFKDEVEKLVNDLSKLDKEKTWSLSINAPWGGGKTSFMNLIKKQINEAKFEIINFNPRNSKSLENIQEDFLSTLASALSKYDARCSKTMKNYMAALQLIDTRGIIEKLFKIYRIFNKEDLKKSITDSFSSLPKTVVVFIDDFDRLSKEEILEVLKLIDSNAAFNNLVYITAYDKVQVDKILGEEMKSDDAYFIDKFFNIEYSIPVRNYSYISNYLIEIFKHKLCVDDIEKKSVEDLINKRKNIFRKYIPTLRDVKRFYNQVVLDYKYVKGDVIIKEFILIELVKFKYPELYKNVFKQKYFSTGLYEENQILILNNALSEKLEIYDILKILFPSYENDFGNKSSYFHIYDSICFYSYFLNKIITTLRFRDMDSIFTKSWDDTIKVIDKWSKDVNSIGDFEKYLAFLDVNYLNKLGNYSKYTEILSYLSCFNVKARHYTLFLRAMEENTINKFHLDKENLKQRLIQIIQEYDVKMSLLGDFNSKLKLGDIPEENCIIKGSEILNMLREKFIKATENPKTDELLLSKSLHSCVSSVDKDKHKLTLDADCLAAYRERIEKYPDYYINHFVFLAGVSSSPDFNSVACDAFWPQIFLSKENFSNFLEQCKKNNIAKIDCVLNFWALYEANNYKPIEFENQGNVQDKIDNDLVAEVGMLKQIKQIDHTIKNVPDKINDIKPDDRENYKTLLLKNKDKLLDIKLNVALKNEIMKEIDDKLSLIS